MSTKNYAKILTCHGSTVFRMFLSSGLLSKILLSDLGTHGCSMGPLEGSELHIIWPIFVIFGGMVSQSLSSNELQNGLDSNSSFPDIKGVAFLLDHPL